MDCREFRETYTDLLDGLVGEADELRFHEHVGVCLRCRRFDQAYRIGLSVLRGLPSPRVSRAFTARVLHTARTDRGSGLPCFASGFAGAVLVVALVGSLAVDLRHIKHREPAASATITDTTVALSPPEDGIDLITFGRRDAAYDPPFWDPYAPVQARDANFSARVRFAVPAVWTGR